MLRLLRKYFAHLVFLFISLLTAMPSLGKQKGKATYYSKKAHGHMTSSGVRLNNDSLVCAHRTHPFGTLLLVKNPANGKEVVVKVIDRGPFTKGMVIDLSYEAARRLDILAKGVAMVEVSVYNDSPIPFKPKDYSLPELSLEESEPYDNNGLTPEWKPKAQEQHKAENKEEKKREKSTK